MIMKKVTNVIEEYMETIYKLQEKSPVARTSEIIKLLKVAPGTVTNTVKRLEKEGLITHVPYKGVKLTEKGRSIALQVIRRHRLSERLLTDLLNVDWDKAHDAACRLEHVMTEDISKKLDKALGHPKTCPHGNPIPNERGRIFVEKSEPLTNLNPREGGMLVKIVREEPELLKYIAAIGLIPGTFLEVVEKAPFDGPITVRVKGNNYALSHEVASIIDIKRE
jgi:DtxR family Mn-dependent transcriptional regulator